MKCSELADRLYHGSNVVVRSVELSCGAPQKDFGQGFYTTSVAGQAEKFARLKARREGSDMSYVSVFRCNAPDSLSVLRFDSANEEWFDFVLLNRGYGELARSGNGLHHDVVIGPVANDAVGLVLNQFVSGVYGNAFSKEAKDTAIRLLLTQKLHNQVFFGTDAAVLQLEFQETYDVRSE